MNDEPAAIRNPGAHWLLQPGMRGDAQFSGCGKYRYWLSRWWGQAYAQPVLWVGMNPSTADAYIDSPTIRREIEFTKQSGLTFMLKVNVFDYRATVPRTLLSTNVIPRSDINLPTICGFAKRAKLVVVAHGKLPRKLQPYARETQEALIGICQVFCLGFNNDGSPQHPLYVPADAKLEKFKLWPAR